MSYETDTITLPHNGIYDGYVAESIVVQHTARGVSVTRAEPDNRPRPQTPPRR